MNNDEQKLDALTNQKVTISLGGKSYQARRATLYDVGLMNKKRNELTKSGDTGNIDMDTVMYILWVMLKGDNPELTSPEDLAMSIPFENYQDVLKALEIVGFKLPQNQVNQLTQETGA